MKLYIVQTYVYDTYSYSGTVEDDMFLYLDKDKAQQKAVELAALYESVCVDEVETED